MIPDSTALKLNLAGQTSVISQKTGYTFLRPERSYENLATDQPKQNDTGTRNVVTPDPTETPKPIPEPTMFILFATGLLGLLGLWRWKGRRTKKP